jgi:hypothetical protein
LSFQVQERGTEEPWILQIDNLGSSLVALAADPRLLWFEVQLPDGKTHVCRLPKPLWPEFAVRETEVLIPPGQSYRRAFDPRFFCFASVKQSELVPNARLTPHFGWPNRTHVRYKRGKRIEEVLPPDAPCVAWMPSAVELGPKPKPGVDPAIVPWVEPTEGLKNLAGTPFTLGSQYASWVSPRKADAADSALVFEVLEAKDAEDERASTVTLGLTNTSKRDVPVYVRQELITYFVSGPDGTFDCSSSSPSPLPQDETAFTALKPGKTLRIVTRLLEVCARGRFGRPGLYQISAQLNVPWSGQKLGVDGFQGMLITPHSALLRVRSGERSFFIDKSIAESEDDAHQRAAATTGAPGNAEPPANEVPAPNDGAHDEGPSPEDAPQLPDEKVE